MDKQPLRLGVAGPVGSGKTALVDALCKRLRDGLEIAVVTNDIYTKEDANFLVRSGALLGPDQKATNCFNRRVYVGSLDEFRIRGKQRLNIRVLFPGVQILKKRCGQILAVVTGTSA